MRQFRVLSDLHLDVNKYCPLELKDKDIFTVICGDTSGYPSQSIDWIKKNCPNGVGVSGNHLPYNNMDLPIQSLRQQLAQAFPDSNSFTYLDCETGTFSKEVDEILFVGTCMYTDMSLKHDAWNPTGDQTLNMRCSSLNMNDYLWGIKRNDIVPFEMISPKDYAVWFKNAYLKIEDLLNKNESQTKPKDVVLITHHPLITDYFNHNCYIKGTNGIHSPGQFIWSSYASDMKKWLKSHTSIKCYCCGHIHGVDEEYRSFSIARQNGSEILIINNARGYVQKYHDTNFIPDFFVDTESWTVENNTKVRK